MWDLCVGGYNNNTTGEKLWRGGFCACKLQKLAELRLVHGLYRIMFIMLNLLCNDNNALAFYAYLWLYHSCVLGAS